MLIITIVHAIWTGYTTHAPCILNAHFASPNVFPFVAVSVFLVVVTVCKLQRFISVYYQFVFLSGVCTTTDVGRTFRREFTLVREVRTTAVSRRLRKTDWCFYSVFVKTHQHSTHSDLLSLHIPYKPLFQAKSDTRRMPETR